MGELVMALHLSIKFAWWFRPSLYAIALIAWLELPIDTDTLLQRATMHGMRLVMERAA